MTDVCGSIFKNRLLQAALFCLMLLLMAMPALAQDKAEVPAKVQLSDFLKLDNLRWRAPKDFEVERASGWNSRVSGAKVVFNSVGSYSVNKPEGIVTLGEHKWVSFWIKGDGQARSAFFYVREGTAESWDQFYAAFQVEGDDWRYYVVDLTNMSRSPGPINRLRMRYTKSSEGEPTDKKLTPGNKITVMTVHVATPGAVLHLSDLQAHVEYPHKPANPDDNATASASSPAVAPAAAKNQPAPRQTSRVKKNHYAFAQTSTPNAITLAQDGRSDFSLVIPANASATEEFSAQELQRYIRQATGAKLPVVRSSSRISGAAIYVGTNPQIWNLPQTAYKGKDADGFALSGVDAKTIVVTGGSDRGVMYGTYAFLEKALDVRFFRPHAFGEIVPQHETVSLPLFSDQEEPVFTWRRNHYCSDTRVITNQRRYDIADWSTKNRYNVELERLRSPRSAPFSTPEAFYAYRGGVIPLPEEWQGHNFHKLIPPSQYLQSNPEYFSYEHATGQRRAHRAQLCMTNPEVHRIIADKAIAYFREHPEQTMLYVCQEDGSRLWCQCEKCLALNPSKSTTEQHFADQNIYLVNGVARLVAEVFPDKIIGTYAYSVTRRPPVNVKPLPNVRVMYCGFEPHINKNQPEPPQVAELRQWGSMVQSGVIVYEYLYSGPIYRETHDAWLKNNYEFFVNSGVVGMIHETRESWGVEGFKMYAASRLTWNPDLDIKALEEDYYQRMYGAAAQAMFKFDRMIQDIYFDESKLVNVRNSSQTRFTEEDFNKLDLQLKTAFKAVNDDVIRARIGYQQLTLQYLKLYNEMVVTVMELEDTRDIRRAAAARRAVTTFDQFVNTNYPSEMVSYLDLRQSKAFATQIQRVLEELNALEQYTANTKSFDELPREGWRFRIDPENVGQDKQWFARVFPEAESSPIRIAEYWEKQGHTYDGIAWYARSIDIPASFSGRKISLVFMGVDEKAWVYLNGELVGSHAEGDPGVLWTEPFVIDLTGKAMPGQPNTLVVRVHDSAAAGGIWKPVYLRSE